METQHKQKKFLWQKFNTKMTHILDLTKNNPKSQSLQSGCEVFFTTFKRF